MTGDIDDQGIEMKFLLRDWDTKYVASFDTVFSGDGAQVLRTPSRTPNANAHAERFVRTIRSECLHHLLILNRRHLAHVLRSYVRHYNDHRPHQGISQQIPAAVNEVAPHPVSISSYLQRSCGDRRRSVRRHDRLGGLIHEYELVS